MCAYAVLHLYHLSACALSFPTGMLLDQAIFFVNSMFAYSVLVFLVCALLYHESTPGAPELITAPHDESTRIFPRKVEQARLVPFRIFPRKFEQARLAPYGCGDVQPT